jgi:hypothetical protein
MTSISFILQPLKFRIYDYPASLALFFMLGFWLIVKSNKFKTKEAVIVLAYIAVVLVHYLLDESTYRAFLLIFFVSACYLGLDISLTKDVLSKAWLYLFVACCILIIVGVYRFIFGYVGEETQHELGIADLVVDKYYYLGIEYTPSTRNTDGFYFGIVYVYSLVSIVVSENKSKILYATVFLLSALVCIFTLSRGLWISLLVSTISIVGIKCFMKYLAYAVPILLAALVATSYFGQMPEYLNLIYIAVMSLYDYEAANKAVSGYYTFSNVERSDIYLGAIKNLLMHPLGVGTESENIYDIVGRTKTLHSENLYLDLMSLGGFFGVFLIIGFLIKFTKKFGITKNYFDDKIYLLSKGMGFYILSYMMFNSGIDFTALWYSLLLVVLYFKSRPQFLFKVTPIKS